jgi:hypothetical protein
MTCLTATPQTSAEWLALIQTCAEAAGGPGWASLAILGAQALALLVLAVALVGVVVGRAR